MMTGKTARDRSAGLNARGRFALDVVALLILLLVNNPALTGIPMHEWLSLGVTVIIAVHLALNWDWTRQAAKRLVKRIRLASTADTVVDAILFVAFVLAMLSGAMISEILAPLFGLTAAGGEMWEGIHGPAAYVTIGALSVHFALHWRWILRLARGIAGPIAQKAQPLEQSGGVA